MYHDCLRLKGSNSKRALIKTFLAQKYRRILSSFLFDFTCLYSVNNGASPSDRNGTPHLYEPSYSFSSLHFPPCDLSAIRKREIRLRALETPQWLSIRLSPLRFELVEASCCHRFGLPWSSLRKLFYKSQVWCITDLLADCWSNMLGRSRRHPNALCQLMPIDRFSLGIISLSVPLSIVCIALFIDYHLIAVLNFSFTL